jgi:cysteinyl-tRNA synthetase
LQLRVEKSADSIDRMIEQRNAARARKDYGEADRIRKELDAAGIVLEDSGATTTWRRK